MVTCLVMVGVLVAYYSVVVGSGVMVSPYGIMIPCLVLGYGIMESFDNEIEWNANIIGTIIVVGYQVVIFKELVH